MLTLGIDFEFSVLDVWNTKPLYLVFKTEFVDPVCCCWVGANAVVRFCLQLDSWWFILPQYLYL